MTDHDERNRAMSDNNPTEPMSDAEARRAVWNTPAGQQLRDDHATTTEPMTIETRVSILETNLEAEEQIGDLDVRLSGRLHDLEEQTKAMRTALALIEKDLRDRIDDLNERLGEVEAQQ